MRKAILDIKYNSSDISADISSRLISFTYNDNKSGTADDIEIVLENTDNIWINDWYPSTGATITAGMVLQNWDSETDININFGTFNIDELSSSSNGTFTIKAIASICDTDFMSKQEYTAWEETTLNTVLSDVAARHSLQLVFDVADVNYTRITQDNKPSAMFITDELSKVGYKLKVSDSNLVVYDTSIADSGLVITPDSVSSWSVNSKVFNVYNSCEVSYVNTETNELISYKYSDSAINNGKTYIIETQVKDIAEAERIAIAKLKELNTKAITASLSLYGNVHLWSGLSIELANFGVFSGVYIIESASHTLSTSGYTTSIEINTNKVNSHE